jgi:hypothetical protein
MRQVAIAAALLVLMTTAYAGCVDVTVNKAWRRCKEDPCSDECSADLRAQYCGFYEDSQCDKCWSSREGGPEEDAGYDAADDDSGIDAGDADVDPEAGSDGGGAVTNEGGTNDDASRACSRNADCSATTPRCSGGACGLCKSNADCSGRVDAPVCDIASGACVLCTPARPDACAAKGKVCKEGGGSCVGCNTNDDCFENAPHCGSSNECVQCVVDADCGKFGKVCDAGQCVQCTGKKTQWCNGTVCDSKARICAVGVTPASADLCEACISDQQCGASAPALCMPTNFSGTDLGYFCQPKLVVGETCALDHRPYVVTALDTAQAPLLSIDGSSGSCRLDKTTCAALADFRNKSCAGAGDSSVCGVANLNDGACAKVPAQDAYLCTTPCGSSADCSTGSSCPSGGGLCSL